MMQHIELKINLEFPGKNGSFIVHIWGKGPTPLEIIDPLEIRKADIQILKNYYLKNFNKQIILLNQVHGNTVINADRLSLVSDALCSEGDALITSNNENVLLVRTADCVPVLIFCERHEIWSAVHAGWRGLQKKIVSQAVKEMMTKTADSDLVKNLQFIIGPHIYSDSYEVGKEVYENFSPNHSYFQESRDEKKLLDLKAILTEELTALGAEKKQVFIIQEDSFKNKNYFSHRNSEYGRNINIIFYKKFNDILK